MNGDYYLQCAFYCRCYHTIFQVPCDCTSQECHHMGGKQGHVSLLGSSLGHLRQGLEQQPCCRGSHLLALTKIHCAGHAVEKHTVSSQTADFAGDNFSERL